MSSNEGRAPQLWGNAAAAVSSEETEGVAALLRARFPSGTFSPSAPVDWRGVSLPDPRLRIPDALSHLCSYGHEIRLLHATGRSYNDLVRARRGDFGRPPDVVALPSTAADVTGILDWCSDVGAACIPFGGGTSVVGGVNPPAGDQPVVTLQLRRMNQVLEVDTVSRSARIQAGATGPQLEAQLRSSDLTLRFYPQSFEYSTVGGWLATRAAGHFATGPTHIDDLVESISAITPAGAWTSARLPASGAGPSPDRLLLGSEGTLAVITEAWLRVQPRPVHRAGAAVTFGSFAAGSQAVRAIVQSGLQPAGCRLLDPMEAALNGAGDGTCAVLVLAFESAVWPVDGALQAALELCRDVGGTPPPAASPDGPSEQWRGSFLRAPYLRDAIIGLGALVETFETATTWDRFDALVDTVTAAATAAVTDVCGDGLVTCRITHAYADGAAPYFTVIAPARRGSETSQWDAVKHAVSEVLASAGATITHHHAVGRDHRRWYDRQRPEVFGRVLTEVKHTLDPQGVLNPGVLLD